MADEKLETRKKNFIEASKKERGNVPPPWAYMIENDFEFIEGYNRMYDLGLKEGESLPVKTRDLVAIGILAFRGLGDGVYEHMRRALKFGATKRELLDAVETTLIPGGAPTFYAGLRALMKIEEEDKKGR
jgi:alkylhydroperoxidase/carboxymuconolactone decarboxylase family protein YurZ